MNDITTTYHRVLRDRLHKCAAEHHQVNLTLIVGDKIWGSVKRFEDDLLVIKGGYGEEWHVLVPSVIAMLCDGHNAGPRCLGCAIEIKDCRCKNKK
jgi:hypothetical protein